MKRREFLQTTALGLAASAVAAPAVAQSMPEIKWRLAASWPKSLDTLWGGVEFFCKRVAEITDNRFQIQPFAAGELVPGLQVLDAVQNGTVEMGNTAMYYYWGKDPAMTFGTALPFGLNSRQMYSWLHHAGGNELLNEVLKNFNCFGTAAGNTGAHETWGWVLGRYDAGNPPALRRLIANGAQLRPFPQEVLEACYKAAGDVYVDLAKTNLLFRKLHDSVVAFRGESSIWMQIAELSYDSFIIRMRARS